MNHALKEMSAKEFDDYVKKASKPVLLVITTETSAPCQQILPALRTLAENVRGKAEVVVVKAGPNGQDKTTFERFGVKVPPALVYCDKGKPIAVQPLDRVLNVFDLQKGLSEIMKGERPASWDRKIKAPKPGLT